MKKIIAIATCLAMFAALSLAEDADVAGSWKLTSQTPRGEFTRTIVIEQDGTNITVTSENRRGEINTAEGTIKGNEITWTAKRDTPRGTIEMVFKGTVDGDTMRGTMEMGGDGPGGEGGPEGEAPPGRNGERGRRPSPGWSAKRINEDS